MSVWGFFFYLMIVLIGVYFGLVLFFMLFYVDVLYDGNKMDLFVDIYGLFI